MRHKRSIPNRGFRVADQIQRDVAELIRDLKDPRIGMVTIHAVEVTPDYAHATVFFSVLIGDPQECETALNFDRALDVAAIAVAEVGLHLVLDRVELAAESFDRVVVERDR